MNTPTTNPYEEKLKRILGQASPNAVNTANDNKIYIVRRKIDYDEWEYIDTVLGKAEAEKLLKNPKNFDDDTNSPCIDSEHMYAIKPMTNDPNELKLILDALKKMPNVYAEDWSHY